MKLTLLVTIFASLAAAQGADAGFTGNVPDVTGAVIPQTVVTALNLNTGVAAKDDRTLPESTCFPRFLAATTLDITLGNQ
jgi:hypothetical protein